MKRTMAVAVCILAAAMGLEGCKKKEPEEKITVVVPPPVPAPLVEKGGLVFQSKCAACHIINGAGGKIGPDLSKVGAARDALFLQTQLQDPTAYKKESKMPSFKDMPKEDKDALIAYLLSLK